MLGTTYLFKIYKEERPVHMGKHFDKLPYVHMRRKVFPCTEISLVHGEDLGIRVILVIYMNATYSILSRLAGKPSHI